MSVYGFVHVSTGTFRSQERVLGPLELALWALSHQYVCWELDSGPLQEHCVSGIAEPTLQPHAWLLYVTYGNLNSSPDACPVLSLALKP